MYRVSVLALLLFSPPLAAQPLVLTGVHVVEVEAGSVTEAQTVVIESGRIVSVSAEGALPDGATVVDVRRRDEWEQGHIEGAHHVAIHELLDHLHHVPDGQLWVHCASGARASIAASLLARAGHDVVLIDDAFDQAAEAGLQVVSG